MEPRFNCIGLLIVIFVGVTAGNLVSTWITAKFTETEIKKPSTEISNSTEIKPKDTEPNTKQENSNQMEHSEAVDTKDQAQLMKQRKYDDNGSRLAKNCNEWREADKAMNTETTKREVAKHCNIYDKYVKTGVLPNAN